jgi:hypothetical protein
MSNIIIMVRLMDTGGPKYPMIVSKHWTMGEGVQFNTRAPITVY